MSSEPLCECGRGFRIGLVVGCGDAPHILPAGNTAEDGEPQLDADECTATRPNPELQADRSQAASTSLHLDKSAAAVTRSVADSSKPDRLLQLRAFAVLSRSP